MRLEYVMVGNTVHLLAFNISWPEFNQVTRDIWSFIHSHQHFPLRRYYRECKKANVYSYYVEETDDITKGLPVMVLCSSWEQHKPYFAVLQEKLNLVIENLPE